jgi:hypothetical protein
MLRARELLPLDIQPSTSAFMPADHRECLDCNGMLHPDKSGINMRAAKAEVAHVAER